VEVLEGTISGEKKGSFVLRKRGMKLLVKEEGTLFIAINGEGGLLSWKEGLGKETPYLRNKKRFYLQEVSGGRNVTLL